MKSQITLLHREAKAKLPNRTAASLRLVGLSPLAFKLALRVVHAWEQRQRELAAVPPSKRVVSSLQYSLPWRDLLAQLAPGARARAAARNFTELHRAAAELFSLHAFRRFERKRDGRSGFVAIHFLCSAEVDDDAALLSFSLAPEFGRAMQVLAPEGFTLVPLVDGIALTDSRDLALLVMACGAWKLKVPAARTVPLEAVKERLALTSRSYDQWRCVWQKLQASAKRVSDKTRFSISLHPVRNEAGAVTGICFEVLGPGERRYKPTPGDAFDAVGAAMRKEKKTKPALRRSGAGLAIKLDAIADKKQERVKPRISRDVAPSPAGALLSLSSGTAEFEDAGDLPYRRAPAAVHADDGIVTDMWDV